MLTNHQLSVLRRMYQLSQRTENDSHAGLLWQSKLSQKVYLHGETLRPANVRYPTFRALRDGKYICKCGKHSDYYFITMAGIAAIGD